MLILPLISVIILGFINHDMIRTRLLSASLPLAYLALQPSRCYPELQRRSGDGALYNFCNAVTCTCLLELNYPDVGFVCGAINIFKCLSTAPHMFSHLL